MQISHIYYTELPASLESVQAVLRCPSRWLALPSGAERISEFWRWGDELYQLVLREDGDSLTWIATPAGGVGPRLRLNVILRDALVVTHATFSAMLDVSAVPWRRVGLRRQLEQGVRDCVAMLVAQLGQDVERERHGGTATQPESATLRSTATALQTSTPADLVASLRPHYPHTVAAFEAMDALDHLGRVWQLEQGWARIARGEYDRSCYEEDQGQAVEGRRQTAELDYDVIYAGGGLGLLHAAVMARRYGGTSATRSWPHWWNWGWQAGTSWLRSS